jgi:hypothetical protein
VVSEPPSNAKSCGIGALHDVGLTKTSGIEEGEFVTPRSHIGKIKRNPHRVGSL